MRPKTKGCGPFSFIRHNSIVDSIKQVMDELLQMAFVRSAIYAVLLFAFSGILGGISSWMFRSHRLWRLKQSGGKDGSVTLNPGQTSLLFFASIGGIGALTCLILTIYNLVMVFKTLKLPGM